MGKKNKKLNGTRESQLEHINIGKWELRDGVKPKKHKLNVNPDVKSATERSNDSVIKLKKKKRKRDLGGAIIEDTPVQTEGEDGNDPLDSTIIKIKKKKKKKCSELNDQDLVEHLESDSASNKEDIEKINIKKKKKKNNQSEDDKQDSDLKIGDDKPQKGKKKKGNIDSIVTEDIPKIQKQDVKQKKKNRSKAKTGAPALNDEEAQVTQEEIDQFCDELDEEDNKQYEDWVKLLDARLSKKHQ